MWQVVYLPAYRDGEDGVRPILFGLISIAAVASAWAIARSYSSPVVTSVARAPLLPVVRIAEATLQKVPDRIEIRGEVQAHERVAVKCELDGRVVAVRFRDGSHVQRGDPLFELDARMPVAREAAARADVAKAKAALVNWQRDEARNRSLVQEGFLSQRANDLHAADLEKLQSEFDRSVAELEIARIELSRTKILAPISGRVGRRLVDSGATLRAADGTTLVEIAQTDTLAISAAFPETRFDALRRASRAGAVRAQVRLANIDTPVAEARLESFANQIERAGSTVEVRFSTRSPGQQLWPGQEVVVQVSLGHEEVAAVFPQAAVFRSQGGDAIYVVDTSGTARLRKVDVRPAGAGLVRAAGVNAGERVVVGGHESLAPNIQVSILEKSS